MKKKRPIINTGLNKFLHKKEEKVTKVESDTFSRFERCQSAYTGNDDGNNHRELTSESPSVFTVMI